MIVPFRIGQETVGIARLREVHELNLIQAIAMQLSFPYILQSESHLTVSGKYIYIFLTKQYMKHVAIADIPLSEESPSLGPLAAKPM